MVKTDKFIEGWESPVAVHPGVFLKEALEEYSLSQLELASRTGISKKIINEIVTGRNPITRSTAMKLSKIFDTSFEYWVNLQTIYENDKARIEENEKVSAEIKQHIKSADLKEAYHEIAKLGLVKKYSWVTKNFASIILSLQKFFGVDSLAYIDQRTFATIFRKYDRAHVNRYSIAAWLRIGELKAQKASIPAFDIQKLKDLLPALKKLSVEASADYLPQAEGLLAAAGVVLVCAPYLKNSNVQGATQWIDEDRVCVIIKTTNQGEDRFWFNLFHEIGHIALKHSKKEIFIDVEDESKNRQEKEADEFAQKTLIPDFEKRVRNYNNYRTAIDAIAKEEKISRSIVAGRIAYEFKGQDGVWALTSRYIKRISYTNV